MKRRSIFQTLLATVVAPFAPKAAATPKITMITENMWPDTPPPTRNLPHIYREDYSRRIACIICGKHTLITLRSMAEEGAFLVKHLHMSQLEYRQQCHIEYDKRLELRAALRRNGDI